MTSPSEDRGAGGFSLVEMLVVLAILSLAVAWAAPALRDGSGRRALRASAGEIAAYLREARTAALLSGSDSMVALDLAGRRISGSWGADALALPADGEIAVLTAREELVRTGAPSFRFFADGGATGGAIRLTRNRIEERVAIDWLTGRIEAKETLP
jgi:general secretion pathway protein H